LALPAERGIIAHCGRHACSRAAEISRRAGLNWTYRRVIKALRTA